MYVKTTEMCIKIISRNDNLMIYLFVCMLVSRCMGWVMTSGVTGGHSLGSEVNVEVLERGIWREASRVVGLYKMRGKRHP